MGGWDAPFMGKLILGGGMGVSVSVVVGVYAEGVSVVEVEISLACCWRRSFCF